MDDIVNNKDAEQKLDISSEVSGFLDWHPAEAVVLERVLEVVRRHYRLAGFAPLYTRVVERPDVLTAKANETTQQQIYGLRLLNPAAGSPTDEKNLALRFDHTVPLVRYVAANIGTLQFPFRRYDIGPVYRGERAKDGRYREFIQADIDTITNGELSFDNDAEMISIINNIFGELNFGEFVIRINNRKILTGFLKSIGCATEGHAKKAIQIIDDVAKIGINETVARFQEIGVTEEDARVAIELLTKNYSVDEAFELLKTKSFGDEYLEGVSELEYVVNAVRAFGVPGTRFKVDLSVARGLDYYTSTVYEAHLKDHPNVGSIAGGGRFENLGERLSKHRLPGVGISIGVDRLLRRLIKFNVVEVSRKTHALVYLASRDYNSEKELHLARGRILREAGIATETCLHTAKIGSQLRNADRKGTKLVVMTHVPHESDEVSLLGHVVVRNVQTGNQVVIPETSLLETVQKML